MGGASQCRKRTEAVHTSVVSNTKPLSCADALYVMRGSSAEAKNDPSVSLVTTVAALPGKRSKQESTRRV